MLYPERRKSVYSDANWETFLALLVAREAEALMLAMTNGYLFTRLFLLAEFAY